MSNHRKDKLKLIFSGFEKLPTAILSALLITSNIVLYSHFFSIICIQSILAILLFEWNLRKEKTSDLEKILISGNVIPISYYCAISELIKYLWKKFKERRRSK
jgi:hypothetical protein